MRIRNCFLFMAMINSFSLTAMFEQIQGIESIDTLRDKYEKVRDKIDYDHLGVSKHSCTRPIVGSIHAYLALKHISYSVVKKELEKIESYISYESVLNKELFRFLVENHRYVGGLVDYLSKFKDNQLRNITGGLVDLVWSFDCVNLIWNFDPKKNKAKSEKIIEKDALNSFFSKSDFLSQFQKMRTIELSGYDIGPCIVELSCDEKYFRVKERNDVIKIWDIQAIPVIEKNLGNVTWKKFPMSVESRASSYSTDRFKVRVLPELPRKTDEAKFKITLTMKRFSPLYKCCCAFLNSNNEEALIRLKESISFKHIGFPRKNLEKLIENKIANLSTSQS